MRHAESEQAGFQGAHAAQAPCGHGQLLDEQGFGWSGGLVLVEKSIAQFPVFLGIFVGEDGGFGGEAVAESVECDGGATFGSARARGELSVATIGVDLTLGKHSFDGCGKSRSRIAGRIGVKGGVGANLVEQSSKKDAGRL